MTQEELIQLILSYPEWEDDLDETGWPTGWVVCMICDGGGSKDGRHKRPIQHKPDCLRLKFNLWAQQQNGKV